MTLLDFIQCFFRCLSQKALKNGGIPESSFHVDSHSPIVEQLLSQFETEGSPASFDDLDALEKFLKKFELTPEQEHQLWSHPLYRGLIESPISLRAKVKNPDAFLNCLEAFFGASERAQSVEDWNHFLLQCKRGLGLQQLKSVKV